MWKTALQDNNALLKLNSLFRPFILEHLGPQGSSLSPIKWMFAKPKPHRYEQGKHYSINVNAIRILKSKSLHSYIQMPGLASQARWQHSQMKYNFFVIASFPECWCTNKKTKWLAEQQKYDKVFKTNRLILFCVSLGRGTLQTQLCPPLHTFSIASSLQCLVNTSAGQ